MGFNFRKSLKIAPGIRLNVTKNGISSVSVGKNGARVNVGKKGTKTTVGLPGTGLSYSKFSSYKNNQTPPALRENRDFSVKKFGVQLLLLIIFLLFLAWIFG